MKDISWFFNQFMVTYNVRKHPWDNYFLLILTDIQAFIHNTVLLTFDFFFTLDSLLLALDYLKCTTIHMEILPL